MIASNRSGWSPVVRPWLPRMELLLLLLLSVTCQLPPPVFHLNPDGYIECYDDLDCPDPVELPNNNTFIEFSCSGITINNNIKKQNKNETHHFF